MGLLKKFGQIVVRIGGIALGLQPLIGAQNAQAGAVTGQIVDTLGQVAAVVGQVEAVGQALNLPGDQKLTGATPLVAQIVLSSLVAGRKINDHERFRAGVATMTTGVVEILNSLDDEAAKEA
jgi:hypothetical protein